MTALAAVQQAVYEALSSDAQLASLAAVYDAVPEDAPLPYVVIGEATEARFDTFGRDGNEETLTLHIWSDYAGYLEAFRILARMNELLDYRPLPVQGRELVYLRYERSQALRDADGRTRHVPADYRIISQETP